MAQYQGAQFGNFDLPQIIALAQRSKQMDMEKANQEKQGKLQDLMMQQKQDEIDNQKLSSLVPEAIRAKESGIDPEGKQLSQIQMQNPAVVEQYYQQQQAQKQAQEKAKLENTNLKSQIGNRDIETQGKLVQHFKDTQLSTAKMIDAASDAINKDPNQLPFQVARLQSAEKSGAISLQGVELPQNADPQAWGQLKQHAQQTMSMMSEKKFSPMLIEAMNKNGISDPNQAMADKQTMIDFNTMWNSDVEGKRKGNATNINVETGNSDLKTRAANTFQVESQNANLILSKVKRDILPALEGDWLEKTQSLGGNLETMLQGAMDKVMPSGLDEKAKADFIRKKNLSRNLKSLAQIGVTSKDDADARLESFKSALENGGPTALRGVIDDFVRDTIDKRNSLAKSLKEGLDVSEINPEEFLSGGKSTAQQTQPVTIDPVKHLPDRINFIQNSKDIPEEEKPILIQKAKQEANIKQKPKPKINKKQNIPNNEPDNSQENGDETSMNYAPLSEKDKYATLIDAIKKGKVDPNNPGIQQELARLKSIGAAS